MYLPGLANIRTYWPSKELNCMGVDYTALNTKLKGRNYTFLHCLKYSSQNSKRKKLRKVLQFIIIYVNYTKFYSSNKFLFIIIFFIHNFKGLMLIKYVIGSVFQIVNQS